VEIRNVSALGDSADRADIFLNGGTFRTRINGDQTPGHNLIVSANSTLNVGRASGTSTGAIHTFGDLTIGANTLTVSAANSYIAAVGNVNLVGNATFNNTANFIVNGAITGNHGFTKAGTGTMTLSGSAPNTYNGTVNVTAGTLVLDKPANTPAITGNLNIGTTGTGTRIVRLEASNQIADTSAVSIGNGGILNLNNFNETIGSLSSTNNNSQVQLGSGTLSTGGNNTTTTFGGVISGSGGLTKQGTGTFTLSGNNTYTGATLIEKGTLRLGSSNRIDDASVVTVAATATFNLNNFNETIGGLSGSGSVTMGLGNLTFVNTTNQAFSGIISGTGGVTMAGSATQTLSGENTFTGTININSGTLLLGAPDVINNSVNMNLNGGTFATGGFSDTLNTLTLTADSTIDLGNGSSVLRFSDSSALAWTSGTTLSITNWTGLLEGGGTDQLYIGTNPSGVTTTQLSQIKFINPFGLPAGIYDARILSSGEIVPVPEPATILAALALLALAAWRERHRLRRFFLVQRAKIP
jgi:autotransporter-associated beta strand protein